MTDKPEVRPFVEVVPSKVGDVSAIGSAHAPFLYFEDAPAFGHLNGIISVTLTAARLFQGEGQTVLTDHVVTAHLRMNIPAARALRHALDGALLLAAPTPASDEAKVN